ncbi:acyl-CoA dehydrogenase family protein [Kutzneria buriramensis]|uniref:Alkylation response protein AidB-like acyl-CoA dehydrogenase n=1 Tax=Kutzneria buriramensis TaxID=1045776 RepID=A0A3E0H7R1_9PSEU|nr:acyl-CoA dehydrogenase family protein [Kutzneria buriramensis]REH39338.1 alkylation response protein AidB-like acyl-CoA dehydrogenase [Kutzneria buriramensis]
MLDAQPSPRISWPRDVDTVVTELRTLAAVGDLDLPLPGGGETPERWAALARLGRRDLALARLAEGHTDAVTILWEAGRKPFSTALYGVWAARSGGTGAELRDGVLSGTVRFCSGAHRLDRALIAALDEERRSVLVEVDLADERVVTVPGTWLPLGMDASDSPDILLGDIEVTPDMIVGEPGFYLDRPGFWLGGIGVGAVWLGGAAGVLDDVLAGLSDPDDHQLAHVGALHTAIRATDALFDQAASIVDEDPLGDNHMLAWICRSAAERAAWEVLDRVPRITGPTPMCRDPRFAQRLADLQVYVRQHHAEKDLAAIGREVVA